MARSSAARTLIHRGIGGHASFPRADVTEIRLDDYLARQSLRKQAGKLLQREAETAGELGMIFNANG